MIRRGSILGDLSFIQFRTRNVLLIGIKSKNSRVSIQFNYHEVFMNLVDYMISEMDHGIVLARNKEET